MNDSVLNEYVNVDWYEPPQPISLHDPLIVAYEPLDNHVERSTLEGEICLISSPRSIPFRMGNFYLLVDSDLVEKGVLTGDRIVIHWRKDPGDHYLTTSYDIKGRNQDPVKWLKEGF